MFIKIFKQLTKGDVTIAGGKGASLGEMFNAGIPVPDGFVVLAGAFEAFLSENKLDKKIATLLASVNVKKLESLEKTSTKIQKLILEHHLTPSFQQEILQTFSKLNARFVAVRSSATAEDSATAAWAGQLETLLNSTETDLLENIKKCWASLFSPRAISYRAEHDLIGSKISVAVVVQKMIEATSAGIAFSAHPVTNDQNQIMIEAGFGLGEAVVSGQITPDNYIVQKKTLQLVEKNVNAKTKALFRSATGGNVWRELTKTQSTRQVLSEKEINELAKSVIKIEKHYGFPVDVEWVRDDKKLFITQSRPITTIPTTTPSARYEKCMTRTLSLIFCEYWYRGEMFSFPQICENACFYDPLFILNPGKGTGVYYDFVDPIQDPIMLVRYFTAHKPKLSKLITEFRADCAKIKSLAEKSDPQDFRELFELLVSAWAMVVVSNVLGKAEGKYADPGIVKTCFDLRQEIDKVPYLADEALRNMAKKIIPTPLKKHLDFLLFDEIETKQFPTLKELQTRSQGYIFYQNKLYTNKDTQEFARQHNIEIIQEQPTTTESAIIRGSVAFPGIVRGKVRTIYEVSQLKTVKKGDILVAPMTTPDLMSGIKLASAIVTDEGGVTCHAAIVSRELKIPCIIGIQSATKILQNNDLVEVDANTGVVKILTKAQISNITLPQIKTAEFWAREAELPLFWLTDPQHYLGDSSLLLYKNGSCHYYFINDSEKINAEKNYQFFKVQKNIHKYLALAEKEINICEKLWTKYETVDFRQLTDKELWIKFKLFRDNLNTYSKIYTKTEASNFKRFEDDGSVILRHSKDDFESMGKMRLRLRTFGGKMFQIMVGKILREVARRKKIGLKKYLYFYTFTELQQLLTNSATQPSSVIEARKKNLVVWRRNRKVDVFTGANARKLWNRIEQLQPKDPVLHGQCAYPGKVIGKVRILFEKHNRPAEQYKITKNEILVTDMTRPNMIMACKNAAAIATDEGGIISHAAIIARELKKPCLVGTKIATQILKTGDQVEVDADNGTVKVLSKIKK